MEASAKRENGKIIISDYNHKIINADGKIKLRELVIALKVEKINLFELEECCIYEQINISKLINDDNDKCVDFFTYTSNTTDGTLDLSKLITLNSRILDVYRLTGIVNDKGVLDLGKITESGNKGKIDLSKINFLSWYGEPKKLILSFFTNSHNCGKYDLFTMPWCLTDGKIDIGKLRNSYEDDGIDLFTYTTNHNDGRLDLANYYYTMDQKIDLFKIDGLVDDNGICDLTRVIDSSNEGKIHNRSINWDKIIYKGKLCLSKLYRCLKEVKINLFEYPLCLLNGKIDLSKICNNENDDNIDLIRYTNNLKDGRIDLAILIDSSTGKLKINRINGLINNMGTLDLGKITNSVTDGKIDILNLFFKCVGGSTPKLFLSSFTDSRFNGKIDLFTLPCCLKNEKIDLGKIRNSINDESINIFKYTINHKDDRIDISTLTDSVEKRLDIFKLNGVLAQDGSICLYKIYTSQNNGKIDWNKLNCDKLFSGGKLCLYRLKLGSNDHKIDLFDFSQCTINGKIDMAKICNNEYDHNIDIFSYTTNHKDGRIDLSKFTDSIENKIDICKFNGVIDDDGRIDISKVFDSTKKEQIDFEKINMEKISFKGKLCLSKLKDTRTGGKIDLFYFPQCITNGKINLSKICNNNYDENIDLIKYTSNTENGYIDLSKLYYSAESKLDLSHVNGFIEEDGTLNLTKVFHKSETDIFDYNIINLEKVFFNGKLCLSKIKSNRNDGKINLFDFPQCITNGKIDICKICNNQYDEKINIFKYTVHHENNKILIDLFRNGQENYIQLSIFSCGSNWEFFANPSGLGHFCNISIKNPCIHYFKYNY